MATITPAPTSPPVRPSAEPARGDQRVEFLGIDWEGYETILKVRGDGSHPKLIYLDGDLLLVSPALPHERLNRRIGFFIDQIILGLRIPCFQSGQTTFRRHAKQGGVEGDHTYYLANEARVRGKMQIDLAVDPPPDLAIEVVYTHTAKAALGVYGRLGVPEVWVCEDDRLVFMVLGDHGRYIESASSLAFPFLTPTEVLAWLQHPYSGPDFEWMEAVHRWVLEVLAPRLRGLNDARRAEVGGLNIAPVTREDAILIAKGLADRKHRGVTTLHAVREEDHRWVIELLFDPPPAGRHKGITILVYKKTRVARSIGLR